ncbi:MAG: GNAT family N-acetyltransferase [Clostridia bacterium]|nr:GNAT family N-acetyltransferase [Clostridia bacterium]
MNGMTARRLCPSERYAAREIFAISMHGRIPDPEAAREECEKGTSDLWGTFLPDGTLISEALLYHYENWFEGVPVPCGAISTVATLPEYRKQGAASDLIREMLRTERREGELFSALFPFRHDFYRRFGFGTVPMQNDYVFTPGALADYRFDGTAELWRPGDPVSDHTALWNRFARTCNMAAVRSEETMLEEHVDGEFWRDRKFCYLLRLDGEPAAYVIFQDDRVPPGISALAVGDWASDGAKGFSALLGFLGRFGAEYDRIEFYLPGGVEFYSLLRSKQSFSVEKKTRQDYMVRALDAGKILGLLRKPAGEAFTVRIRDSLIPENDGNWTVGGSSAVRTDAAPDLSLSAEAFSQLAAGGAGLEEALLRDDVELFGKGDLLSLVFRRKPILVRECF